MNTLLTIALTTLLILAALSACACLAGAIVSARISHRLDDPPRSHNNNLSAQWPPPVCNNCGEDASYLDLAGLSIEYGGHHFCSEGCLEEWLDAIQDKFNDKYDSEEP